MVLGTWLKPGIRAVRSAVRGIAGIPDPPLWDEVWPLPPAQTSAPPVPPPVRRPIDVRADETPNPLARKLLTPEVLPEPLGAYDARSVDAPALAAALLAVPGVVGVFLSRHFATITRSPTASWDEVEPSAIEALREALS
jgi:hypothetical protein